ncbi:ATP-binding protein [Anaerolineales bacterium HSG6]|nr:ATP-binding protein [Anaerolineales bacterium HSG6]MDM8529888.1 ATP-binding protein [Anaerolineales bacterium HSG25]
MKALTKPAILDSLREINQYVITAAQEAHLNKKVAYKLRLAVDEIATNIVQHGQIADRHATIKLMMEIDDEQLTIILEDTGRAYIPHHTDTRPNIHQPLEERDIGGLGLFIAHSSVDELHYERIENYNRHTFVVNRSEVMVSQ